MVEELCRRCGRCCWDWKGGTGARCEHLGEDMRTCLIHEHLAELRPECAAFPLPGDVGRVACDLPEDCGYVLEWKRRDDLLSQ